MILKIVTYSVVALGLLKLNFVNRAKIKQHFKMLNMLGTSEKITLTDADLNPMLKLDDEHIEELSYKKKTAIALQKSLMVTNIYIGLHTMLVLFLFYDIGNLNIHSILSIGLFIGATYLVYVISNFVFMYGMGNAARAIYLSPGHSVPGKSFFSFNPLYGYRYFFYSEQLDDRFGLFDNKKSDK